MASLKAIKGKIRSIDKTRKVTKAMEAVSAAKMRKAQVRALSDRAYARAAVGILARLAGTEALKRHPLTTVRPIQRALYIVITSDKGLAGSLNAGVLKAAAADIGAQSLSPSSVHIIAIGRKANEFFSKRGYSMDAYFENVDGKIDASHISSVVQDALLSQRLGAVDSVKVVFQNFVSTFEQRPMVRTMLPFSIAELSAIVEDIVPAKGKFAERTKESAGPGDYAMEPSEGAVLDILIPRLAAIFVYHALLESQASEHSARMVAMKNASDKAGERVKEFTRAFNKARQAGITREVSEIIGGIEAMA